MTASRSRSAGERMRSLVGRPAPSIPSARATLVVLAVLGAVALAVPAAAEHMGLVDPSREAAERPRDGSNLDVQIKISLDQFRLSGRLVGPNGVAGAWLHGERGPHGFSLDGRVQDERGRAYNFALDAEVLDRLGRSLGGWLSRGLDRVE
jgi:hypothetical protein